jgi:hypothetical protein
MLQKVSFRLFLDGDTMFHGAAVLGLVVVKEVFVLIVEFGHPRYINYNFENDFEYYTSGRLYLNN